jgi:ATP-dependent Clp protease adaptor protein ClpS
MKKEALHKKYSLKKKQDSFVLVLYNDDVNTFDHVIKTLVEVCGHDEYQAEQCAILTHCKGSCEIKTGSGEMLQSMCKALRTRGLKSEVEGYL